MQKKIASILFSTRLTAVLFVVFAAAMIAGTFMDAGQDTSPTAYTRNLVYNTWWFEAIMGFFVINFVGNIFRYRLLRKEKWATLLLHVSFILIFIGAFITRYVSFEGMMAIREGATEKEFLSRDTYVTAYIDGDYMVNGQAQRRIVEEKVDFSDRLNNSFNKKTKYDQKTITIALEKFIKGAEKDIIYDENGESYLKLVESTGGMSHNHFLKDGQVQSIHNILISLNKHQDGAINITNTEEGLFIQSPFEADYMTMATGVTGVLKKDSIQPLQLRSRYVIEGMQMVFPKPVVKGVFDIVKKPQILKGDEDGVVMSVTVDGETQKVNLLGGSGMNNPFEQVNVGGLDIAMKYGSKILELPFSVKLNDFIAERYPGTENSYSSFASEVTVIDSETGDYDYRIFMNHILDHKGYRFFQASFDPDEKGTILSVNHDFWGTWITYIGYFMLYIGMLALLFDRNTRFADLRKMLRKVKNQKSKLITVLLLSVSLSTVAQSHSEKDHAMARPTKAQVDSILRANITPEKHAEKFGHMVVQDYSGRMKPMNTFASEMLRKLSKNDVYEDFTANQVLLSIYESPLLWYNVPIIYLKPQKADSIRHIIGIPKGQKHAALVDFFTEDGAYKLAPYIEDAYKAQIPSGFQKEFKEADQRVNLLYNIIEGRGLKIFPVPNDENNKWIAPVEFRTEGFRDIIKDSLYGNFINSGFSAYLFKLDEAKRSGNFADPERLLDAFKKTQIKEGSAVMLSDSKINAEIKYNKYDIFKRLFSWYMYAGTLMFILLIVQIFNGKIKWLNITITFFKWIITALFLLHTAGLIVRWYISGHAPWSDAYESMIYVAWATMLFGLLMGYNDKNEKSKDNKVGALTTVIMMLVSPILAIGRRKTSDLTIAAGAFVTSVILMVAHWNWMDPSIANLQPVLDSYWLMIHVAVIVMSYGPFALGMILGVVCLFLMIFTTSKNKERMHLNIKELTIINEMALTVGLILLTIGNFLGGMWANESWGRYWGWDPKETWALISIIVYAFVIHMRLIPGLRGSYGFNLASIIAFASILMTYFGVNFYLAGLHSYASGDQIISLKFIAIACGIVAVLGFFGYRGYAKHYKK